MDGQHWRAIGVVIPQLKDEALHFVLKGMIEHVHVALAAQYMYQIARVHKNLLDSGRGILEYFAAVDHSIDVAEAELEVAKLQLFFLLRIAGVQARLNEVREVEAEKSTVIVEDTLPFKTDIACFFICS